MKVAGVIPARWASSRLPGKCLIPICGKPLVQRVWERASLARRLSSLVVATDDERIARAVRSFGGVAVMTRPDHPSGTDRVAEAVRGTEAEVVINIQGDEPLIDPGLIDAMADCFDEPEWDMATAACPIVHPRDEAAPSVVKVVCDARGGALYFSRLPIPFVRDEGGTVLRWRHIGLYAYKVGFLARLLETPPCELEQAEKLEQLRALHIGGRIKVVRTAEAGVGVDTPEDVVAAEAAVRKAQAGGARL
jgi:3-deoxy-manno-octulosonate cytidylyltransferase (CMP-KDO synthetase)